jgi:hypothetical protein
MNPSLEKQDDRSNVNKWLLLKFELSPFRINYSEHPNTGLVQISNGQFWMVPGIQILGHSKTGQFCLVLLGYTITFFV